jgi:hypothetical protein
MQPACKTNSPPSVSQFYRKCGILNISQSYRPLWPITGIVLLYFIRSLICIIIKSMVNRLYYLNKESMYNFHFLI